MLTSAAAALLVGQTAQAQGQPTSPRTEAQDTQDRSDNLLEEVVVTAEKREQSLQDVPVAISAFTDETREVVGINSVQDLTNFTPGLSYTTNNDRVALRGIGRYTNNRSTEGGVAIYNDGFYTSSTTTAATSALFLERTEVLRGPQGTLYGRNSVGGAINLISKRPTNDFYAEVRGQVANFDRTVLEAAVSGPMNENLRYRLVGSIDQQESGYFDNRSGGSEEGGLGDQWQIQGQLEGNFFGDKLDVWLRLDTAEWHNIGRGPGGRSGSSLQPYQTKFLTNGGLNYNPNFGLTAVQPGLLDPRLIDVNTPQAITLESDTEVFHATLHLDSFDIRYVGGHTYYDYRLTTDIDASSRTAPFLLTRTTPIGRTAAGAPTFLPASFFPGGATTFSLSPNYVNDYNEEVWWYSNELNFASTTDGPFQWLFGVYQFHEGSNYKGIDARYPDQPQFANPAFAFLGVGPRGAVFGPAPANPTRTYARNFSQNTSDSYAAYGQLDYEINDLFKVTAGLRYTYDKKTSDEASRIICFANTSCLGFGGPFAVDFSSQVYNPIVNAANPIDPSVVTTGVINAANAVRGSADNGVSIDPLTGDYRRELRNNWSAVTGTAGVDYTPDKDTLVYAKYTRGYKAGGFTAGAVQQYPTTNEEKINAYEIGAKKTFFRRLQANASTYFYDYIDIQIPISIFDEALGQNRSVFANLPKAEIIGFELETVWSPIENLQFLANYSYLNAEITEACCFLDPDDPLALLAGAQPGGPPVRNLAGVTTSQPQNLAGQKIPASTPHRFTVNGNYTWEFTPGSLTASATYVWRDETYSSIFNREFNLQPAFDQVDARLLYVDADDRYTVIGYVKNVFDELGYAGVGTARDTLPPNMIYRTFNYTIPRTYGVELHYRF